MQAPTRPLQPAPLPFEEAALKTERIGRPLLSYRAVASTNSVARNAANAGAAEGTAIVAQAQTAGRGRHGRTWTSSPGKNLTFSLILRPGLDVTDLGLIQIAAAVSAAESIEAHVTGCRCALKWPNDVLLETRKICGILMESSVPAGAREPAFVVLGVGVNVNQDSFPAGFPIQPTSILLESGRSAAPGEVLLQFLSRFEREYDGMQKDHGSAARSKYISRLVDLGSEVAYRTTGDDTTVRGTITGISETGALLLELPDGTIESLHSGDVTTRTADVADAT